MNDPARLSAIPAEALARRARLQAVLQAMEEGGASREPACLQELRAMLAGIPLRDPAAWIEATAAADLLEEAGEMLRVSLRGSANKAMVESLMSRIAPLVQRAQQRRSAIWQLDTRRVLIRFFYLKEGSVLECDDGDLHTIFIQAFRLEGLGLALDLGKRPHPLMNAGLPLPSHVGGLEESMDAVLKKEPADGTADLMLRLNERLPEGLRIHRWEILPSYASPVSDLAKVSLWRWEVPRDQQIQVEAQAAAFMAAKSWPWDRGGSKADAPLDLCAIVSGMRWEGGALCFCTRMGDFQALNPLKVLGAILGLEPSRIAGLVRVGVELHPDSRLNQAERFEPKLKNMYEDAVLLGGASNIVLVDEDDDEPIRLG